MGFQCFSAGWQGALLPASVWLFWHPAISILGPINTVVSLGATDFQVSQYSPNVTVAGIADLKLGLGAAPGWLVCPAVAPLVRLLEPEWFAAVCAEGIGQLALLNDWRVCLSGP